MYKAASFNVLMVSALALFMISAYAVQENNSTANEKISALNNTTVNSTEANSTGTYVTAINNAALIKTTVSENITAKNNTSMNSAAFNESNATAKMNNTAIEQGNTSMKELGENESKSGYEIDKYSTIKPIHEVSANSNNKGPFNVGDNSESKTFGIGTTAKPGLDVSKNNGTERTFELGLPSKPIVDASKFPFMCNIV
jgi:hypothetical protein